MKILCFNSGSSSCKLSLFDVHQAQLSVPEAPLWEKSFDWNSAIPDIPLEEIDVVGHRVVHGGGEYLQPVVITEAVKETIKHFSPLAPLHNPRSLEGIEMMERLLPNTPQMAVFDTAFHATMPDFASTYAGPYAWLEQGIKRYGFHGINYEYCAARCAYLLKQSKLKIVCCHLGNGASMAAIDSNQSVDTTMGFTPLEGLMMGTRSGSVDPGILLYLKQDPDELFHTLNFDSGLKGISDVSGDMREILSAYSQGNPRAILSYKMYIHSIKRHLGAMAAVLGGLDAVVFTAGVGEHSPPVRKSVCMDLSHFGIALDERKNQECHEDGVISDDSKVKVLVIAAEEDWCMACKIEGLWK
jgi:acetate kinase